MAKQILLNTTILGSLGTYHAGALIDDAVTDTAPIAAAGGRLVVQGTYANVDAASLRCLALRSAGRSGAELDEIMGAAMDSSQNAATNTATSFEADLGSTATGKGASKVAIEDATSIYAATDVEGALQEQLTGLRVSTLADDAVQPGALLVLVVDIADGVTADKDVAVGPKIEVLDFAFRKNASAGGASDTIQLKSGATAVSNALDINVAAKIVVRAGTIDPTAAIIPAGGPLRIAKTKASAANVGGKAIIYAIKRA